jgi:hypothetical protein
MKKTGVNINSIYYIIKSQIIYSTASNENIPQSIIVFNILEICKWKNFF